jgi:fructosamine-3-kinase
MRPELAAVLGDLIGVQVHSSLQLSGGDVATAYRVQLRDGRTVFAKTHADPPPQFFLTETAGLRWLRDVGELQVPEVLAVSDVPALLVLEWVQEGVAGTGTEAAFGRSLARLHRAGAPCFGREDRRPTGSRSLPNDPAETWAEFYSERRLRPLADLAGSTGALGADAVAELRRISDRLSDLGGPAEPPARLHGDLWAGNRLVDERGGNWLIDPAAHGGHREFDLAMMRLFGGFGSDAFDAYEEEFPLADGWQERVGLHQLAPLVVHAVKFSGAYVGAVGATIARYR